MNPFPIILDGQILIGESFVPCCPSDELYLSDSWLKNIQTITETDVRYIAQHQLFNTSEYLTLLMSFS